MFKEFITGYVERYGHKFTYKHNKETTSIYGIIINPNKKTESFDITPIGIKQNVKNNILTFIYYPNNNEFLQKDATLELESKIYKILNCDKMTIGENLFYMYASLKLLEE